MARTAHHRPNGLMTSAEYRAARERHAQLAVDLALELRNAAALVDCLPADLQRGDVIVAHERIDQPVTGIRHAADGRVIVDYDIAAVGAGACIIDACQVVSVRPFVPQLAPAH
jgi:hypothetical protein